MVLPGLDRSRSVHQRSNRMLIRGWRAGDRLQGQLKDFDKFFVRTGWMQQLYRKTLDLDFANARGGMGSFSNLRDILSALAYKNKHNLQYLRITYGAHTEEQAWYAAYTEVISRVRWRGLKDSRDVIYACLGMMTTVAASGMPITIHPNYHLTEDVYTHFAALLVQAHPFINVLSAREDPSERRYKDLHGCRTFPWE